MGYLLRSEPGREDTAKRFDKRSVTQGRVGVAGVPHLGESGNAGFAPDADGVVHDLLSRLHDIKQLSAIALAQAVAVTEEAQPPGVLAGIGGGLGAGSSVVVEGNEAPGGVRDIPEKRRRRGEVPIDERDGEVVSIDGVPRSEIVVADDLAGCWRTGADAPTRV